jgi:beta-phosphoglucomutase-like phosphatase (HAD superfamily)
MGTPIKLKMQHIELADAVSSSYTSLENGNGGRDEPWTADSITAMYLGRDSGSSTGVARAAALRNMIGLPKLRVVRTLDLWVASSKPLTAVCQEAARALGLDPNR